MDDLKLIKRHYGEKMMHLCRDLFPTTLETEGLLYKIITSKFYPSRALYEDIVKNNLEDTFKSIIYKAMDREIELEETTKTPQELLKEAGYTLYECHSESDIQSFRHYYKRKSHDVLPEYIEGTEPPHCDGEELCTFNGGRLERCHVFFAVKDNVDEIKRENFTKPERQDEYGTSVLSIQFSRGSLNPVSIKNRYNHLVINPDATFGNNLENIRPGLTKAFEKKYKLHITTKNSGVNLPGYVLANDGKYYKYNYEIDGVYYCPDNIIIDNFEPIHYDKSRYLIIDYFIIDLQEKNVDTFAYLADSFVEDLQDLQNIKIETNKDTNEKTITINNDIIIVVNSNNQIISYKNNHITTASDYFMSFSTEIKSIELNNVQKIESKFLHNSSNLKKISLANCEEIGGYFLEKNIELEEIELPKVKSIGTYFIHDNTKLKRISIPNCITINNSFLSKNENIEKLNLPNVEKIGNYFMVSNQIINQIVLPKCKKIGDNFLDSTTNLREIELPEVEEIGNGFLEWNNELTILNLPNCAKIGDEFLSFDTNLEEINLPYVVYIGKDFLKKNNKIKEIDLPICFSIGNRFLVENKVIEKINLPTVTIIEDQFLCNAKNIKRIDLPSVISIGSHFLENAENLEEINIPACSRIRENFLRHNKKLKKLDLSKSEVYSYISYDGFLKDNPNVEVTHQGQSRK